MLPTFALVRFPCGCAVEHSQDVTELRGLIECPWCSATFMRFELEEWLEGDREPFVISKPTVLVRVGEKLFEVTGACSDCEVLIAREGPGAANLHLRVPAGEIVFLEN